MSCTTSGSLAVDRLSKRRCSSLPSPRTSAVERSPSRHSMTMDWRSPVSHPPRPLPAFALPHQSFSKMSSLVGVKRPLRPLFRADALTPSSARASVTGVFGMDFARLCASNLDRALLTRENAASVARPISSSATTSGTLVPVFAIGDERADCDIAPFGDLRARSTRPLDRAHRRLRASSSAFARSYRAPHDGTDTASPWVKCTTRGREDSMFEDELCERLSVVSALDPSSSARARIPCRGAL